MGREKNQEAPVRPTQVRPSDFEVVFKRNFGPLVGFFLNRGLSRDDAEDAAQETLLKAYRGYEKFRKDSSHATWLFVIAGRVWQNRHRGSRTKKRDGENVSLDTSNDRKMLAEALSAKENDLSNPVALENILETEQLKAMRLVIQKLPKMMRRCLQLYCSGDFKYQEIANLLGIELNTVKSTISQAKTKLKEDLRKEHPEFFGQRSDQP